MKSVIIGKTKLLRKYYKYYIEVYYIFELCAISCSCSAVSHGNTDLKRARARLRENVLISLSEMHSHAGAAASDTPPMKGDNVPHPEVTTTQSVMHTSLQISVRNFGKLKFVPLCIHECVHIHTYIVCTCMDCRC